MTQAANLNAPAQEAIEAAVNAAAADGHLLPESRTNLLEMLRGSGNEICLQSIAELVQTANWRELNDRFFRKLSFGTSGLRGRTVGRTVTSAERGSQPEGARPAHPCIGTNNLNFYNITRATRGLCAYLLRHWTETGRSGRPSIVFSHDTRHFSREFAEFAARVAADSGVDAWLFDSFRPTPELSFAVRELNATAGVMITASHNPPHDNGYKVYFDGGDPIVEPVATGILTEVNAVQSDRYEPVPESQRGEVRTVSPEVDRAYLQRLKGVMLNPSVLQNARGLKIVYTPIHGTGQVFVPAILKDLGFTFLTVAEQDVPDGAFPTVASPNPENAAALQMAIDLADREKADIVIGTDPDCDRMGVAVRNREGAMQLLTGNQTGSLMAWYRIRTMLELGLLTDETRKRATLVKTLVTTRLQDVIAERFGIRCVNTLTGFKYIGAKLSKYERALPPDIQAGYRRLTDDESRAARLAHSSFFVFGGEESYGYLGVDWIRDKDGNGAVVMFAELAAYAAGRGLTVPDLLDEIFAEFGVFEEHSESLVFEGAAGAATMRRLMESYTTSPPEHLGGVAVRSVRNFATETILDEDGDPLPKENMISLTLVDGRRFVVRPSGTEPKIKVYFFGEELPANGERFATADIPAIRKRVKAGLLELWDFIQKDVAARIGS